MTKLIVVEWVAESQYGYCQAMRVIHSSHPRFTVGSRFNFGFFEIATREGYAIMSIPLKDQTTCPPYTKDGYIKK